MLLTAVSSLTLVQPDLYYLPRQTPDTADCYRYQRDVLGTQLQSQGYVEFYGLTHITSQCSAEPSWSRKRQTMLIHKQTTSARSPLADRLAISGDYQWNALTVTGKVMITWSFSISARCMMISILYTSMMRIPTWHFADYGVSTSPRRSMMSPARTASWRYWTTMLLQSSMFVYFQTK